MREAGKLELGKISLVVAITGHIDLYAEDLAPLQVEVTNVLRQLSTKYPQTPLLLLSGLAEGADRVAVRAAIDLKIPYVAVLPMPEKLYRADFVSEGSDAEFRDLLTGANGRVVELPLLIDKPRDAHYEQLGRFLVNYSQILIAIWDQKYTGETGGTGEVVRMKLGEKKSASHIPFSWMNDAGTGPVYRILTRRIKSGPEMPVGKSDGFKYPDEETAAGYKRIYERLQNYNKDVDLHRKALTAKAAESRERLIGGAPKRTTQVMRWVADTHAWADILAVHYQNLNFCLRVVIFTLLGIAGTLLTLLHTGEAGWPTFVGYVACLLAALLLGRWEGLNEHRDRHEDYRALAEALRSQYFWFVAGLPEFASDHYLLKHTEEMAWIRDAMSECALYDDVLERSLESHADEASRLDYAVHWVKDQAGFFRRAIKRNQRSQLLFDTFAYSMIGLGVVALILSFLADKAFAPPLHLASGITFWAAALSWNFTERRGFTLDARRYKPMLILFANAERHLTKLLKTGTRESLQHAEKIILDLGKEALRENGEWLATHRELKLSADLFA